MAEHGCFGKKSINFVHSTWSPYWLADMTGKQNAQSLQSVIPDPLFFHGFSPLHKAVLELHLFLLIDDIYLNTDV